MKIEKEYGIIKGSIDDMNDNEYIIDIICIKKDYRGRGYAKKLLKEFIEKIKKETSATVISLYVEPQSEDGLSEDLLLQFYSDCGFKSHGDCNNLMFLNV